MYVLLSGTHAGNFYQHGLTLVSTWISKHMLSKVWDKITYPFLTSTATPLMFVIGYVIYPTHYNGCNYLSMPRFKLIHASKRGPMFSISLSCYRVNDTQIITIPSGTIIIHYGILACHKNIVSSDI